MSRNSVKSSFKNLTSGLINVADETFVEKFNRLTPRDKTRIVCVYIVAIILLVLGIVLMVVVRNKFKNLPTDRRVNKTTVKPITRPTVTAPGGATTTSDPPLPPLLDRIRAEYPWTSPMCGLRNESYGRSFVEQEDDTDVKAMKNRLNTLPLARPGQFPWTLALVNVDNAGIYPSYSLVCSASLLAHHWALTSALCCDSISPFENGRNYFTAVWPNVQHIDPNHRPSSDYRVANLCVPHSEYQTAEIARDGSPYDIGLIRWSQPLEFSKDKKSGRILINSICLPPRLGYSESTQYEFSGYGSVSGDEHRLGWNYFENQDCGLVRAENVFDFCGSIHDGYPSLCRGDLGGPLVQQPSSNKHFLQYGVATSSGPVSGSGIREGKCAKTSNFVKVVKHGQWINSTIYANGGP